MKKIELGHIQLFLFHHRILKKKKIIKQSDRQNFTSLLISNTMYFHLIILLFCNIDKHWILSGLFRYISIKMANIDWKCK